LKLARASDAIADYGRALALAPDHRHAFDSLLTVRLDGCYWPEIARLSEQIPRRVASGNPTIHPFKLLCLPVSPAIQQQCARNWLRDENRGPQATPNFRPHDRDRLRIAYLSSDFRMHAVAMLIAGLFELHDRSRFELLAVSFGPDDHSEIRTRIAKSADQFHDFGAHGDQ